MIVQRILAYGSAREFHKETLDRWLQLSEADQETLLEFADRLRLGGNHFRDFLDWLEEIALRDGISLGEILKGETFLRVLSDPRLGRNDKLKCLKEELRRLRFPRLSQIEEGIRQKIRELKLKPQIQMTVPAGLEGGALTVQMRATSYEELRRLAAELHRALEEDSLKEIFVLLSGKESGAGLSA